MDNYKRNIDSDIYNKLIELYNSIDERDVFDSKEKFYILFNNGEELIINDMAELISEEYILSKYLETDLPLLYGYSFEDIFIKSKYTAHTHPPTYSEEYKRPSDGDYFILKNYSSIHYVIDESYIYCISFNVNVINGFYGKWNKITKEYISDEHYDILTMSETHDTIDNIVETKSIEELAYKDTALFKIQNDGTIILESNT